MPLAAVPFAHAVEPSALVGGETAACATGQPATAQLAVLPGTMHVTIVGRFLGAPSLEET